MGVATSREFVSRLPLTISATYLFEDPKSKSRHQCVQVPKNESTQLCKQYVEGLWIREIPPPSHGLIWYSTSFLATTESFM